MDFFIAYLILLVALLILLISWRYKFYLIFGLMGLFLFLGIWRFQVSLPQSQPNEIYYYNKQRVEFVGIIVAEPDTRQDNVKLTIKAKEILFNKIGQKANGLVLVTNYLYPEFAYGDEVHLICDLQEPGNINGFDYNQYLGRYDIYSVCYYPKITLLAHGQANFVLASIYKVKNYFITTVNSILPEPQASFLGGLLIGAKRSIPDDLMKIFSETGTTHMVAVSGYNVTIIAVFLMLLAQNFGFSRKKSFWLIIIFLLFFITITGLQASIFRAALMGTLALLATYLGRKSKIDNILVLTVALMLMVNPKILVFDFGFQLSFLATLGLIYLNPVLTEVFKVKKFIKFKSLQIILGDYLLTTISAIIMTTPIILYNFGKLSLIAPLANILVLPLVPLAMLLGFMAGILGVIFQPMGWVVGWLVWVVLTYIIWVLEKLASLPWAYFQLAKIGVWLLLACYLIILGFIWKFKRYWKIA